MIRLIQRRLIIPRGDTGTFSIPVLAGKNSGDASIFTIFNPLTHRKIFEKVMEMSDGVLTLNFTHGDTVNLPVGDYMWDIKFYADPEIVTIDGVERIVGGTEVDSYYAAFQLPVCEIRETGDNLLMADDAPDSALAPSQLNYIEGALAQTRTNKEDAAASASSAASSASEAGSSAANAGQFAVSALDSKNAAVSAQATAESAASAAAASAVEAAAQAVQIQADLASKANVADLAEVAFSGAYSDLSGTPTNVSSFTNDAGYLTQHQDISMKANSADLATVATSGSYADLLNKPTIPSKISDLTDDSGHYTKPVGGIPAEDLAETYLTQHQDISGKANSADLAAVATSGSYDDLSDKPTIPDIQIEGYSIVNNGVANIPHGSDSQLGVIRTDARYGIVGSANGVPQLSKASSLKIKQGTDEYRPIVPENQHESVFYGLAKAANDTTQSQSNNTVGTYTTEAKTAIQTMLDVPSTSAIPTLVSQLTNDAGYLTSYTETDPTVPSWAKAVNKPTYTASEVGAPTVSEMNSAIATAIGNVHQFEIEVVQELPSSNIKEHTVYFVPKTGETNDVYDEYIRVNNALEMIGNTQIDLSNYATKSEIPNVPVQDVQINGTSILSNGIATIPIATDSTPGIVAAYSNAGFTIVNGALAMLPATSAEIKAANGASPIKPKRQHESVFYGLAKAAGDTTQAQSSNAVGTYTDEAKTAILNMFGLQLATDTEIQNIINGGAGA